MTTFQIIAFSFLFLILAGTLFLMLPVSSRNAGSAGFSDCLFTATSAVCVTGLVVRDTVTAWSPFGQAVILFLIQVGGMGVVTAAVSVAFVSGRKIGLMQRSVMQEAISAPQVGGIIKLTKFIIITTFTVELAGALFLLPVFVPIYGWGRGIWFSVFHAVSAFCNAGFDLLGEGIPFSSMTGFAQNALVNVVVILLITVGGIGFLVWNDIRMHGIHFSRYRLQSKIVLVTSAILVLLPFAWFFLIEMPDMPLPERILPSLFQSVTLRTAGFNTMDLTGFSGSGKTIMILWMLIGGSPGSTAGGMKTTTLAMILVTLFSVIRRKQDVECMGRRIGTDTIRNAVAIASIYFLTFFMGGMIISSIEKLPLLTCLFETASALGTVGLSLGITGSLGTVSRLVLISLMFLGRVGGLTLIYAAQSVHRPVQSVRPLEKVTVG
ncbi:MAG: Trk family potassium uptake protein [Clostridia bacterium]|nr:Trk family potassium uptake protein [Clostridia bacterium]